MKKIITGISASAIYTIIGFLILLFNFIKKISYYYQIYSYEFGPLNMSIDFRKIISYDIMLFIIGLPALIASLSAETLACISLHIYNKNHTETAISKLLSVMSLCVLCIVTLIYIVGIVGVFPLYL